MQHRQLFAILAALLAAGGASLYFLGTAHAAEWKTYSGDVHPGHAYALVVPPGAQTLEVALTGENGSAALALYAPDQSRLAYYALAPDLKAGDVASPAPGRYVLIVYEATGALAIRVDSKDAKDLQLQTVQLAREEIQVASADASAPLDKALTASFHAAPVFVTLLYEGSVEGLDAKIASQKGDVLAIEGESGSALSPGLAAEQTGERHSSPANLMGNAYTATVHATSFEGRMVLTALSLPSNAAAKPFVAPAPSPTVKSPGSSATASSSSSSSSSGAPLRLASGKAYALHADVGDLTISAPAHKGDPEGRAAVAQVYDPDDQLVQVVTLDASARSAAVPITRAGEYVVFVAAARDLAVYAQAPGAHEARALTLANETHSAVQDKAFKIEHVPLAMRVEAWSTIGVLSHAELRNEEGLVWSQDSLVSAFGLGAATYDESYASHYKAGEHVLSASGLSDVSATVRSTYYLRDAPQPAPAPAPAPAKPAEPTNETKGNQTSNETSPWWPAMPPAPWDENVVLPRLPLAVPRVI